METLEAEQIEPRFRNKQTNIQKHLKNAKKTLGHKHIKMQNNPNKWEEKGENVRKDTKRNNFKPITMTGY